MVCVPIKLSDLLNFVLLIRLQPVHTEKMQSRPKMILSAISEHLIGVDSNIPKYFRQNTAVPKITVNEQTAAKTVFLTVKSLSACGAASLPTAKNTEYIHRYEMSVGGFTKQVIKGKIRRTATAAGCFIILGSKIFAA